MLPEQLQDWYFQEPLGVLLGEQVWLGDGLGVERCQVVVNMGVCI